MLSHLYKTTTKHSFSMAEYFLSQSKSFLLVVLKQTMGLLASPWLSMAPTPTADASVCITKVCLGSGLCNIMDELRAAFNVSGRPVWPVSGWYFFVSSVSDIGLVA